MAEIVNMTKLISYVAEIKNYTTKLISYVTEIEAEIDIFMTIHNTLYMRPIKMKFFALRY
jgi:hypothetical protein